MDPFDARIVGEVEVLRARVAELEGPGYDFGACVLQVREIDRLRAEIATILASRDAALARVGVLEAALREIAVCGHFMVGCGTCKRIAAAALSSPPPHDPKRCTPHYFRDGGECVKCGAPPPHDGEGA